MIKRLLKCVRQYKWAAILSPVCMACEVAMEMLIPLLMASIVDEGINAGNMTHIYIMGGCMIIVAAVSMLAGLGGGFFAAKASTGFARNLREAMFVTIQKFSFIYLNFCLVIT